eukprot:6281895-Pyramimonas_sp.AAC.1
MDGRVLVDFGSPRADDDFARKFKQLGAALAESNGVWLDLSRFEWLPCGAEGIGTLTEAPATPRKWALPRTIVVAIYIITLVVLSFTRAGGGGAKGA